MTNPPATPFASKSLLEHIARGIIGVTAIDAAIMLGQPDGPWWSLPTALALGGLAIVAFRGCPLCWTIGLIETSLGAWRRLRASA